MQLLATHSVLSPQALTKYVLSGYDIAPVSGCHIYARGVNDTYWVETTDKRYMLRIYVLGWRTESEIQYELDAISHLASKGLAVAEAVPDRCGKFIQLLGAPEGERYAVLFQFAWGKEMDDEATEAEDSFAYGKTVALIHEHSTDFKSDHKRFNLDAMHLIDEPMARIKPFLNYRPSDLAELESLASYLKEWLDQNGPHLEKGFCHGDFHGGNGHMNQSEITFFDFDCCGHGWRAYDAAVFRWNARLRKKEDRKWPEFIRGYRSVRQFSDVETNATGIFIAIRHIWLMGLHTELAPSHGRGWMNDQYFTRQREFLKAWKAEFMQAHGKFNSPLDSDAVRLSA